MKLIMRKLRSRNRILHHLVGSEQVRSRGGEEGWPIMVLPQNISAKSRPAGARCIMWFRHSIIVVAVLDVVNALFVCHPTLLS